MTRALALWTALLTVVWCVGSSGAPGRDGAVCQPQVTVPSTAEMEKELLQALNAERAARSLPEVRVSSELAELARKHSADMARRDVLSHDSETRKSYGQRLTDAGLSFVMSGENVGRGNTFLTRPIHQSFMDSAPHRGNIVNPAFDSVGIGVAIGSRGTYYVTVDFIKSVTLRARADIRAMMRGSLNDARARARLSPIVLKNDLNAAADKLAEAKASGRDASGVPAFRTRTSIRYMTGPDLDKMVSLIGEQDTRGFGVGGIGSAFSRSRQYPGGAYVICVLLVWGSSWQQEGGAFPGAPPAAVVGYNELHPMIPSCEPPVFRPPSEADSLILQVTIGCSHNRCTFCGMYATKRFRTKATEEIRADIDQARRMFGPGVRRVFLADGDAMCLSTRRLTAILDLLNGAFPNLQRVGIYANARDLLTKTDGELLELRTRKLRMLYVGLESGDSETLASIDKGATPGEIVEAVKRARRAGMATSVMVLVGLAGVERSLEHARLSAEATNEMAPEFTALLTYTPVPGTARYDRIASGQADLPSPRGSIEEIKAFVQALDCVTYFTCNHASNYVPLTGRMPQAKARIVGHLDAALAGHLPMKPELLRGL